MKGEERPRKAGRKALVRATNKQLQIASVTRFPPRRATNKDGRVPLTAVSYFSGCGGLDLGFLGGFNYKENRFPRLPIEILKAYDFDQRCVETYSQNIGPHIVNRDLGNLDAREAPKADILIGGFPCQDFSSCGPKRGLESDRGRLYESLIRYMNVHRPLIAVGENVPHLARMDEGRIIEKIVNDLKKPGYRVHVWDLYAPDYGVPQRRNRLFFVCVRDDLPSAPTPPRPTHHKGQHRTIAWAIDDLRQIEDESIPNQSQYFLASKAKKGNGQGDERSRADEPAYTVRANAKSRVQFHYSLKRRLTVRECARLQTFPDHFVFPHSATSNVLQIGNAVPPMLAHAVAKQVVEYLQTACAELVEDIRRAAP